MALSFELGFVPKWYIADNVGRPLAGGYLATFSSLNHDILNPVFTDATGLTTWPYVTIPNVGKLGVLFDENGSQGPFYFQFNTATPSQLYYLEVYDSNGVLQWTIDNYSPQSSGGGSIITTYVNITNMVTNNIMLRNNLPVAPIAPIAPGQFFKIAPGAHSGLAETSTKNTVPARISAGPDIVFLKNNMTGTDTLGFVNFTQGFTFPNGEPSPIGYLEYVNSGGGAGEVQKCVQFPITHGVQNLQNQPVTVSIFARCTGGAANTLTLNWLQFFGDGTLASPSVPVAIQTFTLTPLWQKFTSTPPTSNIPSTNTKATGECGNDGLFLQVQFPFAATTTIDFTMPSVYIGNVLPGINFQPNDFVEAPMYTPRTGYVTWGFDQEIMGGWVQMDDGTIGSAASVATNRKNIDTFPLFNMLYNNVSDAFAPVSGGRTGNAVNDFVANKTIKLTRSLGRVLAGFGNAPPGPPPLINHALGSFLGSETSLIDNTNIPADVPFDLANAFTGTPVSTIGASVVAPAAVASNWQHGGGLAFNSQPPTTYAAVFIKL